MAHPVNIPYKLLAVLFLLGNHSPLFKCNKTLPDGLISPAQGAANRTVTTVSECHTLSGNAGEDLGHAVLQVYMFKNDYARTILPQLSFITPTWSRINTVLSARNTSTCSVVVDHTSPLKFPYFGKVDDYEVITLEYNVTDNYFVERRRFQFYLPFFLRRNLSDIEQWEVFMYVDVTDSHKAIVFWEPALPLLNITKYQLNITCGGAVHDVIEYERVFSFQLPYDFTSPEMMCRFYVRPWLPNFSKWGYRSSSPPVFINREEVLLIWILVMCSLFAALLFLAHRLYEVIILKCKHKISGSALLVYEAKTEQQLKFVCLLAQFLEEDYHIKVHLDIRDIPLTATKDPLKWFLEIVPNSEYFVFLELPPPENKQCVPPGVYSSQKMASENIFRLFKNSSRIIKMELDSCPCEEAWVCSKLKSRYKYILPKDLCKLVGKEDLFGSLLGARLKQSITDCIQEIKCPKENETPKMEFPTNLDQDEEEEEEEIVVSGRRCLLESFHLDGIKSDSDSE